MSVQSLNEPPAHTLRVGLLIGGAVLVAMFAFHGALMELAHRWATQEEYSHGFLIPVVSIWLLWRRRSALRAAVGRPSWTGPVLVLLAFAMHVIGELSAVFVLSQIAFVIVLIGLVLSVGGHRLFAAALVPIAFLLFAIPLPYFIDAELTLRLQLFSSQLGAFLIRLFGIPVYLDGNIIDLGNYQLQVVEACSGLRYLYPLLSISFLAAYTFDAPRWQRDLLFLSAIPIAIAMNGFRIGLVGILVDRWGTAMAEGALHFFEGWIIFLACGALLLLEMYLMSLRSQRRLWDIVRFPETSENQRSDIEIRPARSLPFVTCLVLLCLGGAAVASVSGRADAAQTRLPFAEFPSRIGSWQGRPALLDVETERGLGLSDYLLSDYSRADGNAVNFTSLITPRSARASPRIRRSSASRAEAGPSPTFNDRTLAMATVRSIVSSLKSAVQLNSFTTGSTNAAERLQAKFGRSFTYLPTRS